MDVRIYGYLLSALPEETQNSLVDRAFEEVKKIVEVRRLGHSIRVRPTHCIRIPRKTLRVVGRRAVA
jgi:hypothetical protein